MTVSDITTNSAVLEWLGDKGDVVLNSNTIAEGVESPFLLENLSANTDYTAKIVNASGESNEVILKTKITPYAFFSVDDTISILKDITTNVETYTSIFDNVKMKMLKDWHDVYGAVFSLFLFNEDAAGWKIEEMTDRFKTEFEENANWLKLGFHSQKSTVNYGSSDGSDLVAAYQYCMNEVERFADKICIDPLMRLENFACSLEAQRALKANTDNFVGLHTADDTRASNCGLSGDALLQVQTTDDYYSVAESLYYVRSETRLDSMGTTAANALCESLYNDESNNTIFNFFFHETSMGVFNTQNAVKAVAQYVNSKNIRFSYPYQNMRED